LAGRIYDAPATLMRDDPESDPIELRGAIEKLADIAFHAGEFAAAAELWSIGLEITREIDPGNSEQLERRRDLCAKAVARSSVPIPQDRVRGFVESLATRRAAQASHPPADPKSIDALGCFDRKIYYATHRDRAASSDPYDFYRSKLSTFSVGAAWVSVPTSRNPREFNQATAKTWKRPFLPSGSP
jgi:hypothetical protein